MGPTRGVHLFSVLRFTLFICLSVSFYLFSFVFICLCFFVFFHIFYHYFLLFVYLRSVSCVPNVARVTGMSILDCHLDLLSRLTND